MVQRPVKSGLTYSASLGWLLGILEEVRLEQGHKGCVYKTPKGKRKGKSVSGKEKSKTRPWLVEGWVT